MYCELRKAGRCLPLHKRSGSYTEAANATRSIFGEEDTGLATLGDPMEVSYGRTVYDLLTLLQSLVDAVTHLRVRTVPGLAGVVAVFAVWFLV
jgi:hypothetical protein